MRLTIKEIADLAQVSRGTVDRVIHNRPNVKEEVRERVQKIIDKINYTPNVAGKVLANQNRPWVIGIIMPSTDNAFYRDVMEGILAAKKDFRDFGIISIVKEMEGYCVSEQLDYINELLDKKVNALAIVAIDDDLIRKKIDEISTKIPVVTFISDVQQCNKLCFVGHNLEKGGRVAGELMGKLLGGKGSVAIITTSTELLAHNKRILGFENKMKESYKEVNIVSIIENNDKDVTTFRMVSELLEKEKTINGLYSTTGLGMEGLGDALNLYDPEHKIKVVTFDYTPTTIELMKSGVIDFAIGQDPYNEGYLPLKILSEYLVKKIQPKFKEINTAVTINTSESYSEMAESKFNRQ